MLRGLGLEFAGARYEGQQREVNVDGMMPRQVIAQLTDGLEEWQALDVADRAADFAENEINSFVALQNEFLDRVGDVRDHLDGGTEIIAAPLLREDLLVNASRRDVVLAARGASGKPLVVTQVEIGFRAVIGHEYFAMLVGRHRAGVDVEVGIELPEPDLVAPRLRSAPSAAEPSPLPREETTPPVMKMYRAMGPKL